MNKVIKVFAILFLILLLILGGGYFYYRNTINHPLNTDTDSIEVTVKEGESLNKVLSELADSGKLKSAQIAKFYYKMSGLNLELKPGKYTVKTNSDLDTFLKTLKGKRNDVVNITVVEGFNVENIANAVQKSGLFTKEQFLDAVKKYNPPSFVPKIKERRYMLEGYLYPTTYAFKKNITLDEMITEMVNKTKESFMSIKKDLTEDKYDEILNKAAMIERETSLSEEKTKIASVLNNRLAIKMPLQIDATVLYAIGVDSKKVYLKDMKTESPYNTYFVKTLPIGPICSPSEESIKAVLNPDKTDYIYYILNPQTNKHYFTKDYEDFLQKKDLFYKSKSSLNTTTKINNESTNSQSYVLLPGQMETQPTTKP